MGSLKKNTLWSIAEFLAVLFIQFFVMRYIIVVLGIRALGIWSVLMSAVQLASFFDPGTSGGTGRFLSKAFLTADTSHMEKILATITYITVPLYVALSVILFFPLHHGLSYILHDAALEEGRSLLIFAVCAYVGQTIASAFAGALTGVHLGYKKSQISIMGILLQAGLSLILIKRSGLAGLAEAQLANNFFSISVALWVLKFRIGIRLLGLFCWDWAVIRSVMGLGFGIQASSLLWGAFEASIRFIMSRFGGIEQVGYYEIAYKVASQPRVLAFYMGQSLSPVLVSHGTTSKAQLLAFYRQVYARFSFFGVCAAAGIVFCSPIICFIMLGRVEPVFLLFSTLTACGTAAHIAAIPSELTAVAVGVLRYNILGTLTALVSMIIAGSALGYFFLAPGVAFAVLLSSLLAASIPVFFNNKAFHLPYLPSITEDLALGELVKHLDWRRRP